MTKPETRRIEVGALTRVEGEGALHVDVVGDRVTRVNLAIYEPPRFFEALLVGRPLEDVPDVTARICGICPVAYQNTSIFALEQAPWDRGHTGDPTTSPSAVLCRVDRKPWLAHAPIEHSGLL